MRKIVLIASLAAMSLIVAGCAKPAEEKTEEVVSEEAPAVPDADSEADQGATSEGATEQGSTDQGSTDQGSTDQGSTDQGSTDQ